ncbi:MAG: KTSC domain-containing protein [Bryobacterales bacterium]|nr:KTSC domain-containing protein [Bryobacterales bacterium]MBV9401075.1 KTSC domain-containing protein [Bryobacterales bacterium]
MRVPVHSQLLSWVHYDESRRQLRVGLRSGECYLYFQVPASCYRELLQANSKGAFFNRHVRNRYPFQHLCSSAQPVVLAAPHKTK